MDKLKIQVSSMGGSEKRLPSRSPGSSKIESLSRSARMASIADPGVNE